MYARSCCTCNRPVRTDKMILKGPVQPFTQHSPLSSKLIIVIVFSMINLVISFPITSIQEINQRGQGNMITVVPRLPGQSSSTPVAPRTYTKQPGGSHAGYVAPKQTGTGKTRQVDSGLENQLSFFSHHLVGQLDMDDFRRRFTNVFVHKICMPAAPAVLSPEAWHWRRHSFAWMFCRTWYSFLAFYVAPPIPCL